MDRQERAQIAAETVTILERGAYSGPDGMAVDLRAKIDRCVAGTRQWIPEELDDVVRQVTTSRPPGYRMRIDVAEESTLAGARLMATEGGIERTGVLNFASAKRPGGGFLNGAGAQEESLARASALYASLLRCPTFYHHHRRLKRSSYTDRMIYSPDCPVFRDDDGALLAEPYCVDFITSAAPNAWALRKRRGRAYARLPVVLAQRAAKVLALAAAGGCDGLVLGAWGCGVFQNDPHLVAATFAGLLAESGHFHGRFKAVRFSVFDPTTEQTNLRAFDAAFK